MIVNEEVRKAWRQIYAILKENSYDKLYEEEIKIMVDFIWKHINDSNNLGDDNNEWKNK